MRLRRSMRKQKQQPCSSGLDGRRAPKAMKLHYFLKNKKINQTSGKEDMTNIMVSGLQHSSVLDICNRVGGFDGAEPVSNHNLGHARLKRARIRLN